MSRLGLVVLVGCLCLAPASFAQDTPGSQPPPGKTSPAPSKAAGKQPTKPVAPAAAPGATPATPAPTTAPAAPAAAQRAAAPATAPAADPASARAAPAPAAAAQALRQTYYVALLRHGPKHLADGQPGAMVMAKQHQAHIAQLANLGVLALGGTCEQTEGSDPLVELCVIDAPSMEKARKYLEQDPALMAGHLRAEFVSWLGPKGLCLKLPQPAAAAEPATTAAGGPAPAKPMLVNPNRPNAGRATAAPGAGATAPAAGGAAPAAKSSAPAAQPAASTGGATPSPTPKR